MKQKIKNILKLLKAFVPQLLPQSDKAVIDFATEVCDLGDFPCNDSFLHAIATQIMHIDTNQLYVTKWQFVKAIKRSIANQCAYNIIASAKERQKNEKTSSGVAGQVEPQAG